MMQYRTTVLDRMKVFRILLLRSSRTLGLTSQQAAQKSYLLSDGLSPYYTLELGEALS